MEPAGTCRPIPRTPLDLESSTLAHAADRLAPWHLAVALAWIAALSIGRAPEGILFAALCAISALRLPATWPVLREALRSCRPLVWTAALVAIVWISAAWSPAAADADAFPSRQLLIPLALAPLAAHWRMLLAAAVAGAAFQSACMLVDLARAGRSHEYGMPLGTSDRPMQFGGILSVATLAGTALALARGTSARARAAWIAGASLAFAALLAIASRTNVVATLGGVVASVSAAILWRRLDGRAAAIALAALACAGVALGGLVFERLATFERGQGVGHLVERYTSIRSWIWSHTLADVRAHPLLGGGRDSWAVAYARHVDAADASELPEPRARMLELNTAHSTYLQALHDQGVVGLALVVAMIGSTVAWGLARPSLASVVLLGLVAKWTLSSTMESELNTNHGLAPLGIAMFLAIVAGCSPRRIAAAGPRQVGGAA